MRAASRGSLQSPPSLAPWTPAEAGRPSEGKQHVSSAPLRGSVQVLVLSLFVCVWAWVLLSRAAAPAPPCSSILTPAAECLLGVAPEEVLEGQTQAIIKGNRLRFYFINSIKIHKFNKDSLF